VNQQARFQALKRVGYSIGPSTVILSAGLAVHAFSGNPEGTAMLAYSAAAGATYIGFKKGWPVAFGIAGALAYAGVVTWFGIDLASLWAWGVAASSSLALRLYFEHHVRGHDLDKRLKLQRYETGTIRQQMALMALEKKLVGDYVPVLTGHTPEETALRTAFYDLYKQELPGCFVELTRRGYRAVLSLPANLERAKVRREWSRVSGALAATGKYTLEDGSADNQLIIKYSEKTRFETVITYVPDDSGSLSDPVYLGPDEDDAATLLQILGRHTLVLGTSGNGKSNISNTVILAGVRRGMAIIGIDMKKGVELAPVSPLMVTLAKDGHQAREVFDWLDQETDRRADIMIREGIRDWDEEFGPYILVVVDEMAELTDKRWKIDGLPTLPELNAAASRLYRAFGVYLLEATQAPSAAAFGGSTDSRTNYKNRISTRLEEATHAQYAFGQDWKAKGWDPNTVLSGPGEFMLRNDEYRVPMARKAPYISNSDLAAEVGRLLPFRVGLDGSPWGEGGVPLTVDTRVLNLLRHRDEVTRIEIEQGLGLETKQVYDAIKRLRNRKGIEIVRDEQAGTYRMATEDPRVLVPSVEPPE
jgi:hypothetical protein